MSDNEINAMVYHKRLDIIKGVVAPAIMTENYLRAYREGILDTVKKMNNEIETVTIEKLTRVRFVYYDDDGNEYHVIERDMNTVPNVGDELYLDSDDVNFDLDGWYVKSRVCDLGRNLWRLSISHRNDEINGHIWRFKEE